MQTELKVTGMSCSHCENAVKKAVSAIDGVTSVDVNLQTGIVSVKHSETVDYAAIKNEIEEQGYEVV